MKNKDLKKYLLRGFVSAFLIILSFVLIASNISAIGLGPGGYETTFSPGASQKFDFTALNNGKNPVTYNVYVKGELKDDITCSPNSLSLKGGAMGGFSCTLIMPNSLEPGPHKAAIGIIESAPSGGVGQISVLSAVEARLTVNVPYPGFYVSIKLSANNTEINKPTNIQVKVKNLGKDNITTQIPIEIMSGEEIVGNAMTDEKFIESMKEETFNVVWVANVANAGKYTAVANLVHEDKTFNASTSFMVGDLIINIINLTSEIYPGEIGKFNLTLQNMWSEPVDSNVEIDVLKNNTLLGSKNDTLSMKGFEKKDFKIFWDTPLQETGVYQAKVKLKYGGKEKESLFDFEVKNREEGKKMGMAAVFGLAAILVIIILAVLFLIMRRITKKSRKKLKK